MRSQRVLTDAAKLGRLQEYDLFAGMSDEAIAAAISPGLRIGPATAAAQGGGSVMQISFASSSPTATQAVVQAVVEAYGDHLSNQHRMSVRKRSN